MQLFAPGMEVSPLYCISVLLGNNLIPFSLDLLIQVLLLWEETLSTYKSHYCRKKYVLLLLCG